MPLVPDPPERLVERVVTVALLCILFDGGMHLGWSRFRSAAGPIAAAGVAGTFLTAAGAAAFCHYAFGLDWYVAALIGTAVAPTDPAVVFSVLGRQEIAGRSGTILEGESGANDPVGIALMVSLITAGWLTAGRWSGRRRVRAADGGRAAVGVLGGRGLLWFIRRVRCPAEGLYPLRTLACVFVLYGIATLPHGSGFLAVFVAGILLGDARAPYKLEMERFHSALASLGEIVAFVVLGLTVDVCGTDPSGCLGPRVGPRRRVGLRDPAGAGRAVPDPGQVTPQRTRLHPVRRAERGGADPAGQLILSPRTSSRADGSTGSSSSSSRSPSSCRPDWSRRPRS